MKRSREVVITGINGRLTYLFCPLFLPLSAISFASLFFPLLLPRSSPPNPYSRTYDVRCAALLSAFFSPLVFSVAPPTLCLLAHPLSHTIYCGLLKETPQVYLGSNSSAATLTN